MALHNTKPGSAPRPSIADTLRQAMQQVEYDCFIDTRTQRADPFFKELCLIISEVFAMDPEAAIRINGEEMAASQVQFIYKQISHEHVRLVFDSFRGLAHKVHNKKAYLRTALYNSVFELESHLTNEFETYLSSKAFAND